MNAPPAVSVIVNTSGEAGADVAADGTFTLTVQEHMLPPLELRISAPSGKFMASHAITPQLLNRPLTIDVTAPPIFAVAAVHDTHLDKQASSSGRVIDQDGRCDVANAQVLIRGHIAGTDADALVPIMASRTDAHGYFSGAYVRADYDSASAEVTVGDRVPQPVPLDAGLLAKKLLLVVKLDEKDFERLNACGFCKACTTTVPRSPTSEDLVNASNTYSNDLTAGQCVNFTIPNRTLEEFSFYTLVRTTEPAIKGLSMPAAPLSDGQLRELTSAGGTSASPLSQLAQVTVAHREDVANWLADVAVMRAPGRAALTPSHTLHWDGAATFYQAATIAHGHILHFKQVWNADGYSLGDLLYSLPLAPCEKKQIAIVDWTRREAASRGVDMSSADAMLASLTNNRDISEILATALAESMRGASTSSTWGVGGGLGAAGSFGGGGYSIGGLIGVSAGGGGADSSAWQDSAKNVSANSLQTIRNNVLQAASSVRNLRASVVLTVEQGEQVRAETGVVANHNHCHALTIEYFEVLRHYLVRQHLADVQECLFVPLMMSTFDDEGHKALRWRSILENRLRRPQLAAAFDATDRAANDWKDTDLPEIRYADDPLLNLRGELHVRFQLSRPKDKPDAAKIFVFDPAAWEPLKHFLSGFGVGVDAETIYDKFFADPDAATRDRIFQEQIAPEIARSMISHLRLDRIKLGSPMASEMEIEAHFTLVSAYQNDSSLYVSIRPEAGASGGATRADIDELRISTTEPFPSAYSRVIIDSGKISYATRHMNGVFFDDEHIDADLTAVQSVTLACPMSAQELRNPRAEDRAARRALVAHLNEFIEYYHRVIWWDMDPERRFMLLDGVTAPDGDGRSVASVVENRLIGIVGNSLVMPVAPGFKLDPTYDLPASGAAPNGVPLPGISLLDLYAPRTPVEPMRISVPTPGVFAEAVMGSCNSCEEKDKSRFWKFEKHPCGDEPAAIQPPSTETRRADPGNLEPNNFPAPIINMQTAPAVPDPTGLAAALQILGAASPFRDMAGLPQTQKNAAAAMDEALKAAEYFGGTAAQLAQGAQAGGQKGGKGIVDVASQQQAANNIDKTMRTIDEAQTSGHLTSNQAGALKESAIKQMIGADTPSVLDLGRVQNAQEQGLISVDDARDIAASILRKQAGVDDTQRLTDDPEVSRLVAAAADEGRGISVSRLGESVEISDAKESLTPNRRDVVYYIDIEPGSGADTDIAQKKSRIVAASACVVHVVPYRDLIGNPASLNTMLAPNVLAWVISGSFSEWSDYPPADREDLKNFLREKPQDMPIFGVCAGHQLMAMAYGANVDHMPCFNKLKSPADVDCPEAFASPPAGWKTVKITLLDAVDPIFNGLPTQDFSFSHHDEVTSVPPGFTNLAKTSACAIQVLKSFEKLIYTTQFHPEFQVPGRSDGGAQLMSNFFALARTHWGE